MRKKQLPAPVDSDELHKALVKRIGDLEKIIARSEIEGEISGTLLPRIKELEARNRKLRTCAGAAQTMLRTNKRVRTHQDAARLIIAVMHQLDAHVVTIDKQLLQNDVGVALDIYEDTHAQRLTLRLIGDEYAQEANFDEVDAEQKFQAQIRLDLKADERRRQIKKGKSW